MLTGLLWNVCSMSESSPEHALRWRMPAEWDEHEATWLSWPHDPETWPGAFERIPAAWGLTEVDPAHVEHLIQPAPELTDCC